MLNTHTVFAILLLSSIHTTATYANPLKSKIVTRVLITAQAAPKACQLGEYKLKGLPKTHIDGNLLTVEEYACCAPQKRPRYQNRCTFDLSGRYSCDFSNPLGGIDTNLGQRYVNPKTAIKDKTPGKWWVVAGSNQDFIPACKKIGSRSTLLPRINFPTGIPPY